MPFHTEMPVSSQLLLKVFFPEWRLLTTVLTRNIDSRLVMCEYGTYVEWYQHGKTKLLGEKAVFTISTFAGMESSRNFCGGNSATNCLSPARQSISYSDRKSYRPYTCVCVCVDICVPFLNEFCYVFCGIHIRAWRVTIQGYTYKCSMLQYKFLWLKHCDCLMGFPKLLWNPRFKSLISCFLKEVEDMFFALE